MTLLIDANGISLAQGVYVEAGSTSGLGVLRSRGDECFVITPYHVVEQAFEISIIAQHDMRARGELLRELPGDLAVVRLVDGPQLRCDEWYPLKDFNRMLETQTDGHLVMQEADSSRTLMAVKIVAIDSEFVFVKPESGNDQISERMSGASLRVNGALAGILLDVSFGEGRVYQLDDIMRVTEEYFSTGTQSRDAQSILADPSRVLSEMISARAKRAADISVTFRPSRGAGFPATWMVEPASLAAARSAQQGVSIELSFDQGPFISASGDRGGIIVFGAENAKEIGVRYGVDDPELRGPFWYDVNFAKVAREFFKNRVLAEGGWANCWKGDCWPGAIGQNAPAISRILYGGDSDSLDAVMNVSVPDDSLGDSFIHQNSVTKFGITQFAETYKWDTLYVQLELFDGSVSDVRRFPTGSPYQTGAGAPEVTACDRIRQFLVAGGTGSQLRDFQKMLDQLGSMGGAASASRSAYGRMGASIRASCAAVAEIQGQWSADDCKSCITDEMLHEIAQESN